MDKKMMFFVLYLLILHAITWALLFQDQIWELKQEISYQIACQLNPDSCDKEH
jgi:hypothetical protein